MNKEEFLKELRERLSGLPESELDERISFYREMIDDRMADGQSEEEAVAGIGTVVAVVDQIMSEIPLGRLVGEKVKRRKAMSGWTIMLLVLGSPLWLPLLVAAAAILLSIFVVFWAAVVSLWAADLSLAAAAAGCFICVFSFIKSGNIPGAGAAGGTGLVCSGLAILMFHACVLITKAVVRLMGKTLLAIKTSFVGGNKS